MIYILLILTVSFILAFRSMKDFDLPQEVIKLMNKNKVVKGTIIFLRGRIIHYSSSSSEPSLSEAKGR